MVKSIDTNVMIHRTTEFARQMSERIQQEQHAKDFAAQMEKEKTIHDDNAVIETKHAEEKNVKREKDREQGHEDSAKERKENEKEKEKEEELKIAQSETLGKEIDISI